MDAESVCFRRPGDGPLSYNRFNMIRIAPEDLTSAVAEHNDHLRIYNAYDLPNAAH
jgi:hypothetical protein